MHELLAAASKWLDRLRSPVVGESRIWYRSGGNGGADPSFTVEVCTSDGDWSIAPDLSIYDWPDWETAKGMIMATVEKWEGQL